MTLNDRRENARKKLHDFGKVIFPNGRSIISCVIVDVSDDGAQLLLDAGSLKDESVLPTHFVLHHKKTGTFRQAEVVRRSGKIIGVRLSTAPEEPSQHPSTATVADWTP